MLLRNGAPVDAVDSAGYTPLHYAARNACQQVCETLLHHGADANARTRCGLATPLHRAATHGRAEIVELLLRHRADANLTDLDGNTALHRALVASAPAVCKQLVPRTDLTIVNSHGFGVEKLAKQYCEEMLPFIASFTKKVPEGKEN